MQIQECEASQKSDSLNVGSLIILPTRSVSSLPGGRMIADRVPPLFYLCLLFLSISFSVVSSPLFVSSRARVRANFSDSVTSLLIGSSLVQLSPLTAHKTRLSIYLTDDLELLRANENRTGDKYIFGHGACTGVKKLVLAQLKLDAQGVIRAKISRTSPGFAPISGRTLPNASSPPPPPPLSQSGFLVLPRLSCATNSKATKMGETVQISCSTYTHS